MTPISPSAHPTYRRLRPLLFSLTLALVISVPAEAAVQSWELEKGALYRQTADNTVPTVPETWFAYAEVETAPGDANSITISGGGIGGSIPLEDEGNGYWSFTGTFPSQEALNFVVPSNTTYTLTLSGGALGTLTQQVTLGAAIYANVPYFTGDDFSALHAIDSTAPFTVNWSNAGAAANNIYRSLTEKGTEDELGEDEYPGSVTSESIPGGVLSPGHCYAGTLDFSNETVVSGAGGFGVDGYAIHGMVLFFDLYTILSPTVSPIVGTWQFGDGAADNSGILIFQTNGVYFNAGDEIEGVGEFDGIERGTYEWNEVTGALTVNPQVDTNGAFGLSHPNGSDTVTISGDTLTITDNDESSDLRRVSESPNSIVGGWRICDNASSDTGVLVFLDNGIYFHAEVNDGDPSGMDGMERGTYAWNAVTGALSLNPLLDTNGELGGSHPGSPLTASLVADKALKLVEDSESAGELYRISRAPAPAGGILPGWRLIKTRVYEQTADNTPPGPIIDWNIFCLVETVNPGDAGSIEISGGGIAGSIPLSQEGTYWELDEFYGSEAQLDAEFPSNTVYTLTVSGGDLGTVTQSVAMGDKAYPNPPYLTGTDFTGLQSYDATTDFILNWGDPGALTAASGGTRIDIFTETSDLYTWEAGGANTSTTIPSDLLANDQSYFLYLEFSNSEAQSGVGGFGVPGTSDHNTGIDFTIETSASESAFVDFTTNAGLTGDDALPLATPFNDGVENILKFAFNMNAAGPDQSTLVAGSGTSGLPVLTIDDTGPKTMLKIEFIRRKDAGLVYVPKRSTTLTPGSFEPMTGTVTVTPIDAEFERVVAEEPCDPSVIPQCFGVVEVFIP